MGSDPGPPRSGRRGSRAERQAHGGKVGVDAQAIRRVSEGEPARQRPRKVPSKPQGAVSEPVQQRQVLFAKSTAKRASWPGRSESLSAKELRTRW